MKMGGQLSSCIEKLETERLILRPMTEGDGELMVAWRNSDEIRSMMMSSVSFTLAEHLEWFRTGRRNRLDWMIELKGKGRVIGTVHFKNIDLKKGVAESGRLIGDLTDRRQGFARESAVAWFGYGFGCLGLNRIIGVTRRSNQSNIELNRSLGYEVTEDIEGDDFIRMELTRERAMLVPELRNLMPQSTKLVG
jgi:UDP-4-amino-4,6-dideoxy-N-acetyl-beta-L-altrosamine N-acetyltransferase